MSDKSRDEFVLTMSPELRQTATAFAVEYNMDVDIAYAMFLQAMMVAAASIEAARFDIRAAKVQTAVFEGMWYLLAKYVNIPESRVEHITLKVMERVIDLLR